MVTIKDGCDCGPCDCDWKQKLKEAYSRAIQSVNKIGDETGRVYYPDGTGFVKVPLPTKEQIDSLAEIDGIKASVDSLNKTVPALETQVAGVTESLVSNVEVLNGTTAGKFKVRIDREKAALIDSNDYDLSKVNSIELIQGSGPAMVKAQLTLSDGTVLRSDDFLFTSESIGTDVYISSFTFKAGNVDGTISADIGLNNGTTLEANNFVVPTDPSVVSTITDLQTRMSAVENGSGVKGLDALKVTVEAHTTSINQLDTDVADLMTNKADVNNSNQSIIAGTISASNITKGGVEVATVNDVGTPSMIFMVDLTEYSNLATVVSTGDSLTLPQTSALVNIYSSSGDYLFKSPIYEVNLTSPASFGTCYVYSFDGNGEQLTAVATKIKDALLEFIGIENISKIRNSYIRFGLRGICNTAGSQPLLLNKYSPSISLYVNGDGVITMQNYGSLSFPERIVSGRRGDITNYYKFLFAISEVKVTLNYTP